MERRTRPHESTETGEQLQLFTTSGNKILAHSQNSHEHSDHRDETVPITNRWKKLVVWGNAILGAAGLAVGNTDTLSVTIDGAHNAADAATYTLQTNDVLHPEQSQQKLQQRRKLAHWIITASALGGTAKAGWDMHTGQEHTSSVWDLTVAGASVALNGLMFRKLWNGMGGRLKHSSASVRDLVKHFAFIDMPSAVLALSGSLVQNKSSKLEQAAAVASGIVGAVAFRPTEKNLEHNCLDHAHEDYVHKNESSSGLRLQQAGIWGSAKILELVRWGANKAGERYSRRTIAAILGLGTLAVGLYAYNRFGANFESSAKQPNHPAMKEVFSGPAEISPAPIPEFQSLPSVITLEPGGNVWDTVGQFAGNLQEHDALKDLTLEINGLTEYEASRLPVGFRFQLPVAGQIEAIQQAF